MNRGKTEVEKFARRLSHPAIFDTVREPMLVLDERFRVIRASASFYSCFNEKPKSVLGRPVFSLGNGQWDMPALHELLESLLSQKKSFNDFQVDCTFPSIGRRIFYLNAREIIPESASPRLILLAFQDMTHKFGANHRLKRRISDLERSNMDLEQFANIVSHDLQSPLNRISSFADLMASSAKDRLTDKEKAYLASLQTQSRRMRFLIQDLLFFAKIATQDQPIEEVDISELVNEVLGNLQEEINGTHAKLEIGDLPVLKGRKFQLRQLFQNLIENSLKYRRKDVPPVITIKGIMDADGNVQLALRDNGIGFKQQEAEQIFEPFHRLHGSGNEYRGTGMGLTICRRIIENHGGRIEAKGEPGKGSTFIIRFPARQLAGTKRRAELR